MVNKKSKARIILLGVALIFIIPIFVSWYLVFFTDLKKKMEVHKKVRLFPQLSHWES